jgi:hypothetical protein
LPISAWIQGYYALIPTPTGSVYDILQGYVAKSGQKSAQLEAGSQLPNDVYQTFLSTVESGLMPSLTGRYVQLYTQPSDQFQYPNLINSSDSLSSANTLAPDTQTQLPQEYFKIGVAGFQTISHPSGGLLGIGQTYTVYYPAVNYLIRTIWAVYGLHTYVWTTQTAKQLGYPGWENRTSGVTITPGINLNLPSFGWPQLFSPLNLEFLAVFLIAALVIVTIFNPGIWSQILGSRGSRSTGARKSRKSK